MTGARATGRAKKKLCGAKTRAGTPCKRRAGAGTDHVGTGRCSKHGGSTHAGSVAAAREEGAERAREIMLLSGRGVEITPGEALLTCVRMAWAQVQFFEARVAELELEQVTTRPRRETTQMVRRDDDEGGGYEIADLQLEERLNLWAGELQKSMDRLAKYSKMALDAGVAQQQIDIAKAHASAWAPMLKHVLDGLDLTPGQIKRVPALLRSALTLMASS